MKVCLRYEENRCFDLKVKENYRIIKEIVDKLVMKYGNNISLEQLDRNARYKFIGCACDLLFNKNDKVIEYDSIKVV